MKNLISFLKTTAVGGIVFLAPLVVLVMILTKAFELVRLAAQPIQHLIPFDLGSGLLLADLLILALLLATCVIAGQLAKRGPARRLKAAVESKLAAVVPGYGLVKGITDSLAGDGSTARTLTPVIARFDDNAQIAFEVERNPEGNVVVYLPGAPNPWSGTVVYMSPERVEPLDLTVSETLKCVQRLGRSTAGQRRGV